VFHPHCLWGLFWKRGWDDDFTSAARRFYCRACSTAAKRRVKQASMTGLAVTASVTHPPALSRRAGVEAVFGAVAGVRLGLD